MSSVTPNTGSVAGGTEGFIVGSGFTEAMAVNFGTTAASSFSVLDDTPLEAWRKIVQHPLVRAVRSNRQLTTKAT